MSGTIFLNYRRDDSRWPTLSLFNLLAQVFPREQLFMDVEGYIRPGDDFVEVLEEQVSACKVMIVVIGPQWLSLAGEDGRAAHRRHQRLRPYRNRDCAGP